jgi:hypothetical protein
MTCFPCVSARCELNVDNNILPARSEGGEVKNFNKTPMKYPKRYKREAVCCMESFRGRATNFFLYVHVYVSSFLLTLKLAGVEISISFDLFLVIQRRILNGINCRASNEMDK